MTADVWQNLLWENKNLSCMKEQSETSELCPALRKWLCVCPRGDQSLFSVLCHYSLSWIQFPVHSGFVLRMLWSCVSASSSVLWSLRAVLGGSWADGLLLGVPVVGAPQRAAVQVLLCWSRPAGPSGGRKCEDNTQGRGSQKRKRETKWRNSSSHLCLGL